MNVAWNLVGQQDEGEAGTGGVQPVIQIPVGGPVHDGIDAINTFYRENELAESLAIAGPACVAGNEAAVPLRAVVVQDGRRLELDVIDVAEIDDEGRVLSMRAFFDLEGAREL